jgi:hypothetical protein
MFQDKDKQEWSENLNTPQPIHVHMDGDFLSLYKQDVEIVKVNREDTETIYNAIKMLNGMLRAGVVYGEIEQVRDLLQEIVGS